MPGVQKPHWSPWQVWKAICIGCRSPLRAIPSMVVTARPSASTASMAQLLTDLPSTQTVQAPHWLVSHPTWVPVRRRCSRSRSTSSVRGSTSTAWLFSLTFSVIVAINLPFPESCPQAAGCETHRILSLGRGRCKTGGGLSSEARAGPEPRRPWLSQDFAMAPERRHEPFRGLGWIHDGVKENLPVRADEHHALVLFELTKGRLFAARRCHDGNTVRQSPRLHIIASVVSFRSVRGLGLALPVVLDVDAGPMRHAAVVVGLTVAAADRGHDERADGRLLRAHPLLIALARVLGAVIALGALRVGLARLAGLAGTLGGDVDARRRRRDAVVAVGLAVAAADGLEDLGADLGPGLALSLALAIPRRLGAVLLRLALLVGLAGLAGIVGRGCRCRLQPVGSVEFRDAHPFRAGVVLEPGEIRDTLSLRRRAPHACPADQDHQETDPDQRLATSCLHHPPPAGNPRGAQAPAERLAPAHHRAPARPAGDRAAIPAQPASTSRISIALKQIPSTPRGCAPPDLW